MDGSRQRPFLNGTTTLKGGLAATNAAEAQQAAQEEQQPLGFLDRLLDAERNSSLYLGDVRFWQHMEHIDTVQVYRMSSVEYRSLKLMFCEAIFYAAFLFVLTSYIVLLRSDNLYESRTQQWDYWGGCQRTASGPTCTVDNITDASELMSWMENDLLDKAFTFRDHYPSLVDSPSIFGLQDRTVDWTPRYTGDTKTSVLLGTIRVRQLRVQWNRDCEILPNIQQVQNDCFAEFSAGVQSTFSWAPAWTPTWLTPYYEWHPANMSEQMPMSGRSAYYPGDGFYFDLPLSKTEARNLLTGLGEWQWLDQRSRAVIVELNTLIPNVNVFVNTRMLFEFPATGGLRMSQEVFAFRALQLSLALMATDDAGGVFVYFILTIGMTIMLFVYTVYLIRKNGLRFFTYFWGVVDVIIILTFLVYIGYVTDVFRKASGIAALQPEVIGDMEAFFPISTIVKPMETGNGILAWLGLVSWLKILKYFSLVGPFHPFVRIMEKCIWNLFTFAQLMIIVLMGFAVALYIRYGDDSNLFSTLRGCFVASLVAPTGGVDFGLLFAEGDALGPVLGFAYMIVVFLLCLNYFMAVCVDTYTVCMYQISQSNSLKQPGEQSPTAVFLWTYFNALKGLKLVSKESVEQIGEPDEQQIRLVSLPEVVQQHYLGTKKKMERILDAANTEMTSRKQSRMLADGQLKELPNKQRQSVAKALEDKGGAPQPPAQLPGNVPEDTASVVVKRVQLQRMLDDDSQLRDICGTDRAVDILRNFRVDNSGIDPYAAIDALQNSVSQKLAELEASGVDLTFDELETLKQVSTELHNALTESQKEWRQELLTVMQMASLLSASLVHLTKKLEAVQLNHNDLSLRTTNMGRSKNRKQLHT